jgi:S1-C subfamily serine protease
MLIDIAGSALFGAKLPRPIDCSEPNVVKCLFVACGAIAAGLVSAVSLAHAEPSDQCRRAKTTPEKLEACSLVINTSRNAVQLERAYLRRGNALAELNRFAEAANDFTALIQINPTIAGYYDNRLNARKALGQFRGALEDADMEMRLAPSAAFVYRSRGSVYDAMGRYDAAIADFTRATAIDPRDAGLLIDRGKILSKAGRDRDAIRDFTQALEVDHAAIAALRERGMTNKKLGDFSNALADLTLFSRLEPHDIEVTRAIEEIEAGSAAQSKTEPRPAAPPEKKKAGGENSSPPASSDAESSGTGFFASSEGHVVTNSHVVDGCSEIQLTSGLAPPVAARILARDTANDLALLKSDLKPSHPAVLRVGAKIGEEIAAFGYPLVGLLSTNGNFTVGNISAVTGLRDDTRYIQISAPIQPGNSGGPVVDRGGDVVGVVVSKLDVLKVAAAIDDVPQNVNFAIKSAVLTNFLDANGISYSLSGVRSSLQPAELAEEAKSISVFVKCMRHANR